MEHENYLRGDLSNSNKPPIVRQKYSDRTSGQQPIKSHTLNPASVPTKDENGDQNELYLTPQNYENRMDSFRSWSMNKFRITKQWFNEWLGRAKVTIDPELEKKIRTLNEMRSWYWKMLEVSKQMVVNIGKLVESQRQLGAMFSEMALRSPELQVEFVCNGEAHMALSQSGEILLDKLKKFIIGLDTLCNTTMEDTQKMINNFTKARQEYDAYVEYLAGLPKEGIKYEIAEKQLNEYCAKFETLKSDLKVKFIFLEGNRREVLHKYLLLFHNSRVEYFKMNQQSLEPTLLKLKSLHAEKLAAPSLDL